MDTTNRVAMTVGCRDADPIPKVIDAGRIVDDAIAPIQIMHNGMRVLAGAYHGEWMARVIDGLRGHHEPQEERVFHHLICAARPGSVMVELASFWAYYTIWYLQS